MIHTFFSVGASSHGFFLVFDAMRGGRSVQSIRRPTDRPTVHDRPSLIHVPLLSVSELDGSVSEERRGADVDAHDEGRQQRDHPKDGGFHGVGQRRGSTHLAPRCPH